MPQVLQAYAYYYELGVQTCCCKVRHSVARYLEAEDLIDAGGGKLPGPAHRNTVSAHGGYCTTS